MKKLFLSFSAASVIFGIGATSAFAADYSTYSEENNFEYVYELSSEADLGMDYIDIQPAQLLFPHQNIFGADGVFERGFTTASATHGNRMNVFFDNFTNASATVTIERRTLFGGWTQVGSMTVSGRSQHTDQFTNIQLTTDHRVVVRGAGGAAVNGQLGIRQVPN